MFGGLSRHSKDHSSHSRSKGKSTEQHSKSDRRDRGKEKQQEPTAQPAAETAAEQPVPTLRGISYDALQVYNTGLSEEELAGAEHSFSAEARAECAAYSRVGLRANFSDETANMNKEEKKIHTHKITHMRSKLKNFCIKDLQMPVFSDLLEHKVNFADLPAADQQGFYRIFVRFPPKYRRMLPYYQVLCDVYRGLLGGPLDEDEDDPGEWGWTAAEIAERLDPPAKSGGDAAAAQGSSKSKGAEQQQHKKSGRAKDAGRKHANPDKAAAGRRKGDDRGSHVDTEIIEARLEAVARDKAEVARAEAAKYVGRAALAFYDDIGGAEARQAPGHVAARFTSGARAELWAYQVSPREKTWDHGVPDKTKTRWRHEILKIRRSCDYPLFASVLNWPHTSRGAFFGDLDEASQRDFCDYFLGSGRVPKSLTKKEREYFPFFQNLCDEYLRLRGLAAPPASAGHHDHDSSRDHHGSHSQQPTSPMSSAGVNFASLSLRPSAAATPSTTGSDHVGSTSGGGGNGHSGGGGDGTVNPMDLTATGHHGGGGGGAQVFRSHESATWQQQQPTSLMSETLGEAMPEDELMRVFNRGTTGAGSKRALPPDTPEHGRRPPPPPQHQHQQQQPSSSSPSSSSHAPARKPRLPDAVALGKVKRNGQRYNFGRSEKEGKYFYVDDNGAMKKCKFEFDDPKAEQFQGWAVDPDKKKTAQDFDESLTPFYCRTDVDKRNNRKHEVFYFMRPRKGGRAMKFEDVPGMDRVAKGW